MVLVACLVASVVVPDAPDAKSVADRMHGTVVQVRGSAGETSSWATGVLVGPHLAVTPLHAVAARVAEDGTVSPLPRIDIFLQGREVSAAQIVSTDAALDLALLRLPDRIAPLPSATFAAEDPAPGDTLIAMGAGEDAITVIDVTIVAMHGSIATVASKHPVDSRFWGGPLFDFEGRLAAIELTALGEPRAVAAGVVKAWIERASARNQG